MKLEIHTFTSYHCSQRFTIYETWFNKSVVIVEEEMSREEMPIDEWVVRKSISVPKEIFVLMKNKILPANVASCDNTTMGSVSSAEENFHVRIIGDRFELPLHIREVLFNYDRDDIPLFENQLGYISDMETLEWYWDTAKTPEASTSREVTPPPLMLSPPSEDNKKTVNAIETPIKSKPQSSPECPPAPKKQKVGVVTPITAELS